MPSDRNNNPRSLQLPDGAWEEFMGALEAATGGARRVRWRDPMEANQVREAFDAILMADRPDRGLEILVRSGVMESILPEVQAMVGFGEGIRHKDVWAHTKQVIRQSPSRLVVRWAALLHDIGKVPTRRFEPDGQVTFIGHPEVGARMFRKIARRIPFEAKVVDSLRFLIASHLRASAYDESWTDSAVRRFARDAGEDLDDLLDLSRADITSKYEEKVRRGLRQIDLLARRVEEILERDSKPPPLPKGLGNALIAELGISPGPTLGAIMARLKKEVESGRLGGQREYDHYIDFVRGDPDLSAML